MASLAARMRGVRLERGFASFRKGCWTHIDKEEVGKVNQMKLKYRRTLMKKI